MQEVVIIGPVGAGKSIFIDRIREEINASDEFAYIHGNDELKKVQDDISEGKLPLGTQDRGGIGLEELIVRHKGSNLEVSFKALAGESYEKLGESDLKKLLAGKIVIALVNPFFFDKELGINAFIRLMILHTSKDSIALKVKECALVTFEAMAGMSTTETESFAKTTVPDFNGFEWNAFDAVNDSDPKAGSNLTAEVKLDERYSLKDGTGRSDSRAIPLLVNLMGRLIDSRFGKLNQFQTLVQSYPEKTLIVYSCVDLLEKTTLNFTPRLLSLTKILFGNYRPMQDQAVYSASIDAKFTADPIAAGSERAHQRHFIVEREKNPEKLIDTIMKLIEAPAQSRLSKPPQKAFWATLAVTGLIAFCFGYFLDSRSSMSSKLIPVLAEGSLDRMGSPDVWKKKLDALLKTYSDAIPKLSTHAAAYEAGKDEPSKAAATSAFTAAIGLIPMDESPFPEVSADLIRMSQQFLLLQGKSGSLYFEIDKLRIGADALRNGLLQLQTDLRSSSPANFAKKNEDLKNDESEIAKLITSFHEQQILTVRALRSASSKTPGAIGSWSIGDKQSKKQ